MSLKGRTQKRRIGSIRVRPRPRFAIRPFAAQGNRFSLRAKPPGPPPAPPSWRGPGSEWAVWFYLTAIKKWEPGIDFIYQAKFEGGRRPGGLIPDFLLINRWPYQAVPVQGLHWHSGDPEKLANNVKERMRFLSAGWTVTEIWEDDLLQHYWFTMRTVIDGGRELPREGRAF
jgi:hypothetical protein